MARSWDGVLCSSRSRVCFLLISPSSSEPLPMCPFSPWLLFLTVEGGIYVSQSAAPSLVSPLQETLSPASVAHMHCSAHQVSCRRPVSVDFKGLTLSHLHLASNSQDLAGTSQLPSGTSATLRASQKEGFVDLSPQLSCGFNSDALPRFLHPRGKLEVPQVSK